MLDPWVCDRARLARDARFDGRFFTGVLTTRIYCRPICPVRPARSENVRFFPSATAAERAGFRPCLRCRPEAAPGTPDWQGSASVVSRGLALIQRGFLDERSSDDLAAVLSVGTRQLSRLFSRSLGATPGALARTRRVQLAKRLLDETTLSATEIAFAAGFSSLRRFNAAFAETYGRTPSEVRRLARQATGSATLTIRLAYRPPFHWPTFAALLASEATPGVESVDERAYRRTVAVDGRNGWLEVSPLAAENCLALVICLPDYAKLRSIVQRAQALFDLNADPARIRAQLAQQPRIAPLLAEAADLRLPGVWDGFELALRTAIARDVGPANAAAAMQRLVEAYGVRLAARPEQGPHTLFPTAVCLAEADLRGFGLACHTSELIRRAARAVSIGKLHFSLSGTFDDLVNRLQMVGFDRPTAHWIAMRSIGEPDAMPFGTRAVPGLDTVSRAALADQESWRPWRSYVAVLLAAASLRTAKPPAPSSSLSSSLPIDSTADLVSS